MEFELEPVSQPDFIGREAELKWLDERLLRRSYSFTPVVVSGLGGFGKTTLLKQWFATRRIRYRPLWIDLGERLDERIIDEVILQLRKPSERHLFEYGMTVVLDGADHWSQERVNDAVRRLFNYKIVSSVVIIGRQAFNFRGAEHLQVGALNYSDSDEFLKGFLESHLTVPQLNQAFAATNGNPLALKLLAQLLKGGTYEMVMASLRNEPIYEFPRTIILPEKEIIQVTRPLIVSAENRLIQSLQKQPGDLRQLNPRMFEQLLADLLADMGWEVELTPATRDGGSDILAYMNTELGRFLCLVEAKHYREDRKVGVELVRTLYGTLCDAQANSAMPVTSSSFTKDARDFQQRHEYQLKLREYADVVKWILNYGKNK
jgi:restriction system protein